MVFCFGEILLRMSPVLGRQWINESEMSVYVGGAELNVASALAKWEVPAKYFSALPDNYLSKEIIDEIASKGIDTSAIQLSGSRIGSYYLPQGADMKNAGVIYDRAYSSFSELEPGTINWDEKLKGCTWFHFSAISPALSEKAALVCKEAVEAAVAKGLTISIDLNYRSKLWKYGKAPHEVMHDLVRHCNVIMGNIWSAWDLLQVPVDPGIHDRKSRRSYYLHAGHTAKFLRGLYPACKIVANTFRFDKGDGISYFAVLDNEEGQFISPDLETDHVVDKVGSGDCFMGGLIYGIYNKQSSQDIIDFAAAAAFGKLQEKGDTTNQTAHAVQKLLLPKWKEARL